MTTVLRGAEVIDGTGGRAFFADVVIDGARIVGVTGPGEGHGDAVVDLAGLVLSPGFIDIHTHYDAQILWDPDLTPSSWHGITTTIMGNCGFGIAPALPEHRTLLMETLENVEGMSVEALAAGIPWTFESFPEYLTALQNARPRCNFAALVGHSALRIFVMGEDAYSRAATTTEVAAMRDLLVEALGRGALGFSTSRSHAHAGAHGRPVPSRFADRSEIFEIADALRIVGTGVIQVAYGSEITLDDIAGLAEATGRPVTWTALPAGRADMPPDTMLAVQDTTTGELWAQISCRPIAMQVNLANPFAFARMPAFARVLGQRVGDRAALYADPVWRAQARSEVDDYWVARWEKTFVHETVQHKELVGGPSLAELARQRGVTPLDLLCDLSLAEDLSTRFLVILDNDDDEALATLLQDDRTLLGLSDAGAHADQLCDACFSTHLLEHWVRELGVLTLEKAVWRLTGHPAAVFRLADRGRIAPGYIADLVAFDKNTVGIEDFERVWDLPANAERLIVRSRGVEAMWVNGQLSRANGQDIPGIRAGQLLSCT